MAAKITDTSLMGGAHSAFKPPAEVIASDVVESIVTKALNQTDLQNISSGRFRSLQRNTELAHKRKQTQLNDLKVNLMELSKANENLPINPLILKDFERKLNNIIFTSDTAELIILLKDFSEYVTYHSIDHCSLIVETLLEKNRGLREYFNLENLILTSKSIELILNYFEDKFDFEKNVLSCQSLDEIPSIIERIADSSSKIMVQGVVVYNAASDDSHVTPIFIYKHNNMIRILVTDSQGQEGYKVRGSDKINTCKVLKRLISYFNDTKKSFSEQIEIYSYSPLRQRKRGSCSIFSILDLKNLYEGFLAQRDIFAFINEDGEPKNIKEELNSNIDIFEFWQLPPDLMKVTQSLHQIEKYRELSPFFRALQSPVFHRAEEDKEQDVKQMNQSINASVRVSPNGRRENKYVTRKRLQFIYSIIEQVLK